MENAKSAFKHKVDEYSKKLRVKVEKTTIKHLKNRCAIVLPQIMKLIK
jgi:hypothetical protein